MPDALLTRASLLLRLRDPKDALAWKQFVDLYGSLIYGFARQRGLQDADAADLTQEVFGAVAKAAGRWQYDPNQGTFRSWLYAITRNKISQFFRRRTLQPTGTGDSGALQMLNEQPDGEADNDAAWEQEYRQQLFHLAADQVKNDFAPKTWQAFWQTAVEGKSAPDVAAALGLSVGAVYVAKSRVLARLTEQVQQLQAE
jgi:RNA polymerase sigma factor (sigma-70 family)